MYVCSGNLVLIGVNYSRFLKPYRFDFKVNLKVKFEN